MNVHHFVADKLSEVVLMKHKRQLMMVRVLAVCGVTFLSAFAVYSFYRQAIVLGVILSAYSIAGIISTRLVHLGRPSGIHGLTFIVYSLCVYLVFTGGYQGTGSIWAYPLSAIGIFINPFSRGVAFSIVNLITLSVLLGTEFTQYDYSAALSFRLILTLMALSVMCHIVVYFQSKMDDYILKMDEEGIQELAYMDSLTMLANRASFLSVLSHVAIGKEPKRRAIIYCDLDNFKAVNDRYGHDMGDIVLSEFALRLKQLIQQELGERVQKYDVARLGGDEFAVFVRDVKDGDEVLNIGKQVIALFEQQQIESLNEIDVEVNVSVGIAFESTAEGLRESLKTADKAMYQAKKAGQGKLSVIEEK
ncbi:hypothetical protein TW81_00995 [Vibrio galatheae]|uniref:GGDEF domain-containing protein n=1 Tax=Vibrio galatheae TaxID=579748 RepID=A0A0F4NQS1_9VIBR|nr:GGDEF domain-containing protein [Vibrio galatheae]KJY85208.1 hypothetical protein TW81_00995 [Vibrio galatheae]